MLSWTPSEFADDLPAILGGRPARPFPLPDWPVADDATAAVLQSLGQSGDWGRYHAEHSTRLIDRLAAEYQVPHVHLTSSGTAAVELALRGLKVGPGDEVILSAYDFKANFTNIILLGAKPVLVDVDRQSGQLDVSQLQAAFSPQTKAILASHLHGGVVDMPRLTELAAPRQIPVIEDLCQMPLAMISGRQAGTWGQVGVLSFGGSKLISSGRGGAVFTSRDDVQQRIKLYTQRGNDAYPLSEMQAAILLPQLDALPQRKQTRQFTVQAISEHLSTFTGLQLFRSTVPDCECDYYKVGFWYDPAAFSGLGREPFCQAMRAEGFSIDSGFRSHHRIHARSRFRAVGELTHADGADQHLVVLHHPVLLEGPEIAGLFRQALDKIRQHATILQQQT